MSVFHKATKSSTRIRLALIGPSGSGKTWTALSIATGMGGRVALVDTEHGSASKYCDHFSFDTLELGTFDPRQYIEAIQAAQDEGYRVIIIDSLSHAWTGKGGALELVDKATVKSRSKNAFTEGWREVTPLHNALIDAIVGSSCHVIATMRSKVDYVMETDPRTGKQAPRKVGLAPVQREGMDYEFDITADMDVDHNLIVGKTRWSKLDGEVIKRPGVEFGRALAGWLADGPAEVGNIASPRMAGPEIPPAADPDGRRPSGLVSAEMIAELSNLMGRAGMDEFRRRDALAKRGVASIDMLGIHDAQMMIHKLNSHLARKTNLDELAERIVTSPVTGERLPDAPVVDLSALPQALAARDESGPDPYVPNEAGGSADDYAIPDKPRRESPEPRASKSRKATAIVEHPSAIVGPDPIQPASGSPSLRDYILSTHDGEHSQEIQATDIKAALPEAAAFRAGFKQACYLASTDPDEVPHAYRLISPGMATINDAEPPPIKARTSDLQSVSP